MTDKDMEQAEEALETEKSLAEEEAQQERDRFS